MVWITPRIVSCRSTEREGGKRKREREREGKMNLSDGILYEDGIQVEFATSACLSELRKVFATVWLKDNTLYSTLKISPQEFDMYVDIVFDRLKKAPNTAVVGFDTTTTPRKLVSFGFWSDLNNDVIPVERYQKLSPNMQKIIEFNDFQIQQLFDHPLYGDTMKGLKIAYGLHAGTHPQYVGRELKGSGTISQRVMMPMVMEIIQRGYIGMVGVATHQTTAERSLEGMASRPANGFVFAVGDFQTWRPKDAEESDLPPFRSIESPRMSLATFNCLPGFPRQSKL